MILLAVQPTLSHLNTLFSEAITKAFPELEDEAKPSDSKRQQANQS